MRRSLLLRLIFPASVATALALAQACSDPGQLLPGEMPRSVEPSASPSPLRTPITVGPDLVLDRKATVDSLEFDTEVFAPDSCDLEESCIGGPGLRRLLRMETVIQNLGTEDFLVGDPVGSELFTESLCHGHFHLKGVMKYELLDATGAPIFLEGLGDFASKQAFCMRDDIRVLDTPAVGKFDCGYQGISSGWADVYYKGLECQFIDITDVPAGDYTLRMTVNPELVFTEADYSNNSIEIPVQVPPGR